MAQHTSKNPADYIVPLNINRLEGRMLRLPAPKTKKAGQREILFVYGLHSSLERWWGLAQALNRYGAVTMPDLPGFGGMDSFYTIGRKPTIDAQADYLAAFIKLRFRRKKIVIVGLSYGFMVATRMLQNYPELTKKVTLLVSLVGSAHHDDITFSKPRFAAYTVGTTLLSARLPAALFYHTALQPFVLRAAYGRTHNAKNKYAMAENAEELQQIQDAEVKLWRDNDVRTWAFSVREVFKLDNCDRQVAVPVWHVGASNDHFFNNDYVEQHLHIVFKDLQIVMFDMKAHAPSVIADEKMAAALIPPKLKRFLSRMP